MKIANRTLSLANESIRLVDGRRLGFSQHGDPTGKPIFVCHGAPGSRAQHGRDVEVAATLGLRVIVPERPGYGLSDAARAQTFMNWNCDLAALADHLQIDTFSLIGWSIGGVYAMACAHAFPARVCELALIAALAPPELADLSKGMSPVTAELLRLARDAPVQLAQTVSAVAGTPQECSQALLASMARCDQDIAHATDIASALQYSIAQALHTGVQGITSDFILTANAWGFAPDQLQVTTRLWHGTDDLNIPIAMGRYLGAAIPGCQTYEYPGEGHLLFYTRWAEILQTFAG